MAQLITLRVPLPWDDFALPNPLQTGPTALATGDIGWAWSGGAPELGVPDAPARTGTPEPGWDLDHVVVLVPDLGGAATAMAAVGLRPRLEMEVGGRAAAFYRAGPLLEFIESPVRSAAVFGVALVATEPLEVIALRWRGLGRSVDDPVPALQAGRRIMTVRATEIGLSVMSPDRAQ